MTEEELKNENVLYLTVGKEVKMQFDENDNLEKIRLSTNKIGELFSNGTIDETSIFDVSMLGLITMNNFKTYVRLDDQRQVIDTKTDYKYVGVNKDKTRNHTGNKKVAQQGHFMFFVAEDDKHPRGKMVQLFNHNTKRR